MTKYLSFIILGLLIGLSTSANAVDTYQVLDKVQANYEPLQNKWHDIILPFAYSLFWKLVALDVAWSSMKWVMERKDVGDLLLYLAQKTLTVGFFFSVMKFSDTWIPAIINTFALVGKTASGAGNLTPDGILAYGIDLGTNIITTLGKLGISDQIVLTVPICFIAICVVLAFAVIAGQLLIALIESYLVVGGGIIMLGFSGSKWTVDMATSYLKYAVGTGVKIMVAYLIIGAGVVVFKDMSIDANHLIKSNFSLLAETAVFVYLAWSIPSLAASMVSGAPSSSLGGIIGAATTAAAAVVGTGAAVGGAGVATAGATKSLASGASALGSRAMDLGSNLNLGRGNSLENLSGSNVNVPDPTGPGSGVSKPAFPNGIHSHAGSASNASIGSANESKKSDNPPKSGPALHEKIKNLGSFAPNDQASVQVTGFNLSHGKE